MRVSVVWMGALLCLTAYSSSSFMQDQPAAQKTAPATESITGCVDQQNGQYVLLNLQMERVTDLRSAGVEKDVFAKFVGHKVLLKGIKSAGAKAMFTVSGIENLADTCSQAK